ncbi:hypothetical protein F5Y04DRAFT_288933 [Hypomontagnella monticulosa]|nr:hypothetical protein F5Y04DRAFT_288933 [Hypomontagnella monticulosa]
MAGVPPGPTFTPGMDFKPRVNGAKKLPLMGELKAVVTVNLGEGRPLLIIDARLGEARLREKIDVKPDTELTIKPDYICQFYEDRLEVRYGLFVHAFFHHFGMPKGSIPIAIKFGDLLTPHVPMPPKPYKPGDETPVPSEDVEQAKQDLEKYGYALVKNALTPEQVVILKRAVLQQAAGEVRVGVATQDGGPNNPNQRLWSLSNKGDEFLDLLNHSLIDAIVPSLLGEHAILNDYSANIARPGNVPTQLHMDQIAIQPSLRNIACGITILWFLADVTEKNGGTRVFPGSHTGNVAPADLFDFDGTVAAEGRAGTALVMDSRLWHATGLNTETSGERPILITIFVRLFIRRRENYFLSLRPEVEAKISNRIKRLLGFYTTGALGGVEGEIREGIYVKRVENPIGPLREAGVA